MSEAEAKMWTEVGGAAAVAVMFAVYFVAEAWRERGRHGR